MRKTLFLMDKLLLLAVFILLGVFRSAWVVIISYVLIVPYLVVTKRKDAFLHLTLSTAIAFIWVALAKNQYYYNSPNLNLGWFPAFPFFAWSLGLIGSYFLFYQFEHYFKLKSYFKQVLSFSLIYIPLLIIIETVSYHVFNIKNIAAVAYSGLPICQCIHAPVWMQISYIFMGPVYFIICKSLGLENPHKN